MRQPPIRYRVIRILSAASFALCVAVLVVWSISAMVGELDLLHHDGHRHFVALSSVRSHIDLAVLTNPWRDPYGGQIGRLGNFAVTLRSADFTLGTYVGDTVTPPPERCFVVILPYWLVFAVAAALPAAVKLRELRVRRLIARRRYLGLCVACGYDLRSRPERCPECGTINLSTSRPHGS